MRHVEMLEEHDHTDIAISLKAHDVLTTVAAYRLMDRRLRERDTPYALAPRYHGSRVCCATARSSSSIGLGILLFEGIGDTIRVSLAADPIEEVPVCWSILKSLGLREKGFEIPHVRRAARRDLGTGTRPRRSKRSPKRTRAPVKVAVMGCVVNGPGESKMADVGVAGGKGKGAIYRAGELVGTFPEDRVARDVALGDRKSYRREVSRATPHEIAALDRELRRAELQTLVLTAAIAGHRHRHCSRFRARRMMVDGERVESDVPPMTTSADKVYVPLRSHRRSARRRDESTRRRPDRRRPRAINRCACASATSTPRSTACRSRSDTPPFRVRGRVMVST